MILNLIIAILHITFLIFMVAIPFTTSNYFLMMHVIIVPFVVMHWVCEQSICAVSMAEKKIRKMCGDESGCISCDIVEPVYNFEKNHRSMSVWIYGTAIGFWFLSIYGLVTKYNNGGIVKMKDMFRV